MKWKSALKHVLPLLTLAAMVALPLLLWATPLQASPADPPPHASGQILVKFEPGTSPAERAAVHRRQGGTPIAVIPGIGVEVVGVPARAEEARAAGYARNPHVAFAEPDYIAHAMQVPVVDDPNDTYFGKQWGLHNTGQEYDIGPEYPLQEGTEDADIDAPEAWASTTGSGIIIAILDSGIDLNHPDLDGKLVGSYNFTDSPTEDDNYGHGTHVAGIAAAETNNGVGVAGLAGDSSLLNAKVLGDVGWGLSSWIAEGIVWATDNDANVINMSLGFYRKSRTLQAAVDYAWDGGVLLAAAAGNDGTSSKLYPAAYPNCIAVAATDDDDQRVDEPGWWASNYGDWVDVAAPGLYIYSTFPTHPYYLNKEPNYDYGSGTSMATPFVSGLAGLLLGQDSSRTNSDVRTLINDSADPIPGTGIYWIHGRINAFNAVSEEPQPEGKMHVSAIDMWSSTAGKNYFVSTSVTILDENSNGISGATVDLTTTLPDGTAVDVSEVTGVDGTVTFTLKSKLPGIYVSSVTNVAHTSYTYNHLEIDKSLEVP